MERQTINNLEGLAKTMLLHLVIDHVLGLNGGYCSFKLIY